MVWLATWQRLTLLPLLLALLSLLRGPITSTKSARLHRPIRSRQPEWLLQGQPQPSYALMR
jgi:hypothetical protein